MSFSPLHRNIGLLLLAVLWVTLFANSSFASQVFNLYPWSENVLFLVSMGILLFFSQLILIALFSLLLPLRLVLAILLVLAAVCSYFTDSYGTVFDQGMLRNLLETNATESADLLSWNLLIRVLLLGILPAIVVWKLTVPVRWWREKGAVLGVGVLALVGVVTCVFSFSAQYASFFREHKSVRHYITPGFSLYSAIYFGSEQLAGAGRRQFEMLAANAAVTSGFEHDELVILVVGETARADHMALNGYARDTSPRLSKEDGLINYSRINSCGTSTAQSVPCMFSYLGHNNFDVDQARNEENVLDLLAEAGVKVLWRDNNSDSKGVALRVTYEDFRNPQNNPLCDDECRDPGMLSGLQEYIDRTPGDKLIVLHQMGSHGPAYYKRYPKIFEYFTPVCKSTELSQCSEAEVINAYDNSLRYTDYFLSEVIALLKRNSSRYETSMLYVSDHGESLGEHGLYLHGMPYSLAPEAQTHVPLILWTAPGSGVDYRASLKYRDQPNSHDAIFDSLLQLFEVGSELPAKSSQPLMAFDEER